MKYTESQIANAKRRYENFLVFETLANHDVATIGVNTAEQRIQFHNNIVSEIKQGNKELEIKWKTFFLNEEVKEDRKIQERKAKLTANKDASSDILAPIKESKRLGEFGKWLNTAGNPFRKEHFSKKYSIESVNSFLSI